MQTPGVFVNVVTKSGSDAFHGATWFLRTDRALGSTNVTDDLRREGANSGNPLVYTNDYGGQIGGPIRRGRAWFWGTYGMQNVRLGFSTTTSKRPAARRFKQPARLLFRQRHRLLEREQTRCAALGSKFSLRPFAGNLFTVANSFVSESRRYAAPTIFIRRSRQRTR